MATDWLERKYGVTVKTSKFDIALDPELQKLCSCQAKSSRQVFPLPSST